MPGPYCGVVQAIASAKSFLASASNRSTTERFSSPAGGRGRPGANSAPGGMSAHRVAAVCGSRSKLIRREPFSSTYFAATIGWGPHDFFGTDVDQPFAQIVVLDPDDAVESPPQDQHAGLWTAGFVEHRIESASGRPHQPVRAEVTRCELGSPGTPPGRAPNSSRLRSTRCWRSGRRR